MPLWAAAARSVAHDTGTIARMTTPQAPATQRYHGLDGLRGFAMLLGIVLHASLPYFSRLAGFESFWLDVADPPQWPIFFWGDLDDAGMAILAGLKSSFSTADAWRPGYEPMLEALVNGRGHAPEEAGKALQAPVTKTGCDFADEKLIPALRRYRAYVDQEYVI